MRSSNPPGAWMLNIRTGTSPSLRKPCSIPGGTSTKVPGGALTSSSPKKNVISPSMMKNASSSSWWTCASSSRPAAISMIPKLKRGVSAVRARNSTLPTRWPSPGGITTGRLTPPLNRSHPNRHVRGAAEGDAQAGGGEGDRQRVAAAFARHGDLRPGRDLRGGVVLVTQRRVRQLVRGEHRARDHGERQHREEKQEQQALHGDLLGGLPPPYVPAPGRRICSATYFSPSTSPSLGNSPRRAASATASVRVRTPSLRRIADTWWPTVLGDR